MQNPVDSQPIASVLLIDETCSLVSTESSNFAVSARKPFVEPTVSAATDVLEVTQYFQGVGASGFIGPPTP